MTVEPRMAQPAREVSDATDPNERDHMLRKFGTCAAALRNVLHQDRLANEVEFLFIESHFQVILMAYLRWKRKQRELPTEDAASPPLKHDARSGLILPW